MTNCKSTKAELSEAAGATVDLTIDEPTEGSPTKKVKSADILANVTHIDQKH